MSDGLRALALEKERRKVQRHVHMEGQGQAVQLQGRSRAEQVQAGLFSRRSDETLSAEDRDSEEQEGEASVADAHQQEDREHVRRYGRCRSRRA